MTEHLDPPEEERSGGDNLVPLFRGFASDSRVHRDHPSVTTLARPRRARPSRFANLRDGLLAGLTAIFNDACYLPDSPWDGEELPWT